MDQNRTSKNGMKQSAKGKQAAKPKSNAKSSMSASKQRHREATKTAKEAPRTFHRFEDLPMEVRHMIYRLMVPRQVVYLSTTRQHLPDAWDQDINVRRCHFGKQSECKHSVVERVFVSPNERINILELCPDSRAWAQANDIITLDSDLSLSGDVSKWITRRITLKNESLASQLRVSARPTIREAMNRGGSRSVLDLRHDTIRFNTHHEPFYSSTRYLHDGSFFDLPIMLDRLGPSITSKIRHIKLHLFLWTHLYDIDELQYLAQMEQLKDVKVKITKYFVLGRDPWWYDTPANRKQFSYKDAATSEFHELLEENPEWTPRLTYVEE